MNSILCEICGHPLRRDGTCLFCASYLEMDAIISEHQLDVFGWSQREHDSADDALDFLWGSIEQDFSGASDADVVLPEPNDGECTCPLCTEELSRDSRFRRYDQCYLSSSDDGQPFDLGQRGYHDYSRSKATGSQPNVRGVRRIEYVAFDIEISKVIPDGALNWDDYRPFGISCAATIESNGSSRTWHGTTANGTIASKMTSEQAAELVRYLQTMAASGKKILTWNGAGFDFKVLAEESGLAQICRNLAYQHVDMMFHFFCLKGFPLGLDKAAKGLGLPGKMAEVGGAKAPQFWLEGRYQEVLNYVLQDVRTTLDVCTAVEEQHSLGWTSGSGNWQTVLFPTGWLTVCEALRLPLPDTSWMSNPWPRSRFTDWIMREGDVHHSP